MLQNLRIVNLNELANLNSNLINLDTSVVANQAVATAWQLWQSKNPTATPLTGSSTSGTTTGTTGSSASTATTGSAGTTKPTTVTVNNDIFANWTQFNKKHPNGTYTPPTTVTTKPTNGTTKPTTVTVTPAIEANYQAWLVEQAKKQIAIEKQLEANYLTWYINQERLHKEIEADYQKWLVTHPNGQSSDGTKKTVKSIQTDVDNYINQHPNSPWDLKQPGITTTPTHICIDPKTGQHVLLAHQNITKAVTIGFGGSTSAPTNCQLLSPTTQPSAKGDTTSGKNCNSNGKCNLSNGSLPVTPSNNFNKNKVNIKDVPTTHSNSGAAHLMATISVAAVFISMY